MIPPLIVLAGCSTSRGIRNGAGDPALPGLARGLLSAGAPAVIAMTGAVSDGYATRFTGELYDWLASEPGTDAVTAFAAVRRLLAEEADRESPGESPEWHIPALFVREPPSLVLSDPGVPPISPASLISPASPESATPAREPERDPADLASYFVGRRAELRDILGSFQGGSARVLVCGMDGIGKTSFINATIAMLDGGAGIPVRISANKPPEQLVAAIIRTVRERGAFDGDIPDQAVLAAASGEPSWSRELARVRERALPHQPVMLVLDASDADLVAVGDSCALAYPELGTFLAAWMACGDGANLLVASPRPFRLPGGPDRQPETRFLGPLSDAETLKLAFQLPAVRAIDTDDALQEQLPRLSGHPRALVRLNSLLAEDPRRDLNDAAADAISAEVEAIGPVGLLAGLDPDDALRRLVTGASVYRRPVSRAGMNWQLANSLDLGADAEPMNRFGEVSRAPELGAAHPPRLRGDIADQQHPADDPRLAGALRNAMALGFISGPFRIRMGQPLHSSWSPLSSPNRSCWRRIKPLSLMPTGALRLFGAGQTKRHPRMTPTTSPIRGASRKPSIICTEPGTPQEAWMWLPSSSSPPL